MMLNDPCITYLAAQYFDQQLQPLPGWLDSIKNEGSPDSVHQVRVICRRIRAGLRCFSDCFNKKELKKLNASYKNLARGLTKARDKDVQLAFLKEFQNSHPDKKLQSGINRIILRYHQARQLENETISKCLKKYEKSERLTKLSTWSQDILNTQDTTILNLSCPANIELARNTIWSILNDLLSLRPALDNLNDHAGHHKMRIITKRLRYTLEIFKPVLGKKLNSIIKNTKKMQTLAGLLQDCYVWIDRLPEFIIEEETRTREYYGHTRPFRPIQKGIETLLNDRQATAENLLADIKALWLKYDHNRYWQRLMNIIDAGESQKQVTNIPSSNNTCSKSPSIMTPSTPDSQIIKLSENKMNE